MLSAGVKNLDYVAKSSVQKGHILFGESVCGIYGRSFLVTANFFLEAAANGGKGSTYCHVLKGEGLYDPADPWGQPKGDMVVKVCFYTDILVEPRFCAWKTHSRCGQTMLTLLECHSAEAWCL